MAQLQFPTKHYVYKLTDPRTDLPFYVGKGQGDRAWQHEKLVRANRPGGNPRKVQKIRDIILSGNVVGIVVVAEYDLASDALSHEYDLVDADPTLTNVLPGGGGVSNLSPAQMEKLAKRRARLLEIRRIKLTSLRAQEHEAMIKARSEGVKRSIIKLAGTDAQRAEVAAWLDAQPANILNACMKPSAPRPLANYEKAALAAEKRAAQQAPKKKPQPKVVGLYGRFFRGSHT